MSGIFINTDAENIWLEDSGVEMNADGIRKEIDFYAGKGGVEAILFNMNFQRSFYDTKVGTPIWKDCEIRDDGKLYLRGKSVREDQMADEYRKMVKNCLLLHKNCPEFMRLRYDYCHEIGTEMWHSMRMNDTHHTALGYEHLPQHSDLWVNRKDLLRAWYRHAERIVWNDNCFDYGQTEAYQYHLAMVREYLLDYESDGIELDWLRSSPIFKPGYDQISTPIFTQFIRDTKSIALQAEKKWGHRIRIAVRVPGVVQESLHLGMDVATWAKEGLIDVLIPTCTGLATEGTLQIGLWRLIAPKPVILAPNIDFVAGSHWKYNITICMDYDCGFASNFYQQGADTIYLFNHYLRHFHDKNINYPDMQDFFAMASDRKAVSAHRRRHIVTRHEPSCEGGTYPLTYPPVIWAASSNGGVKINCGEGNAGKSARVIVGATVPLDIDIRFNTEKCIPCPAGTPLPDKMPAKKDEELYYVQAEIPAGVLHDGWNDVEIFNRGKADIHEWELMWMEVVVDPSVQSTRL